MHNAFESVFIDNVSRATLRYLKCAALEKSADEQGRDCELRVAPPACDTVCRHIGYIRCIKYKRT